MEERREVKRTPVALFIRFSVADEENINCGSFTQDASVEGVKLLSPYRLKPNVNLKMCIDIPNDPDIAEVEGNVRWAEGHPQQDEQGNNVFPAGIVFTNIERQDKTYLEEFLEQSIKR